MGTLTTVSHERSGGISDSTRTAPAMLSPQERRQRNRQEMVTAILNATRDVMRERGVAALSLREVGRRVRLQAPSLYAYFPSKAALYDAVFLMAIRGFRAYRDRNVPKSGPIWDRLYASFASYMQFARENPDLYQLAFERPVPGFVPSDDSMAESVAALRQFDRELEEAVAEGRLAPGVPLDQARDLIIAMNHGLTSQQMANDPDSPIESGRYGRLIPEAIALFQAAWDPKSPARQAGVDAPQGMPATSLKRSQKREDIERSS
jgi:AcrR family transcriptional regulator